MSGQPQRRHGGERWTCPACGLGLRPHDAVIVVTLRPFHAACAEASFDDRSAWDHAAPTTLSQWATAMARGTAI